MENAEGEREGKGEGESEGEAEDTLFLHLIDLSLCIMCLNWRACLKTSDALHSIRSNLKDPNNVMQSGE